jgi:hypothetical protein
MLGHNINYKTIQGTPTSHKTNVQRVTTFESFLRVGFAVRINGTPSQPIVAEAFTLVG